MAMNAGDPIGYVIPEWPGQTHLWIWREICHMREFGTPVHLFSTRRPPERDKARHGFVAQATSETTYLWPMSALKCLGVLLLGFLRNPIGFIRCILLAFTLPIEDRHRLRQLLPLLAPACYL